MHLLRAQSPVAVIWLVGTETTTGSDLCSERTGPF